MKGEKLPGDSGEVILISEYFKEVIEMITKHLTTGHTTQYYVDGQLIVDKAADEKFVAEFPDTNESLTLTFSEVDGYEKFISVIIELDAEIVLPPTQFIMLDIPGGTIKVKFTTDTIGDGGEKSVTEQEEKEYNTCCETVADQIRHAFIYGLNKTVPGMLFITETAANIFYTWMRCS